MFCFVEIGPYSVTLPGLVLFMQSRLALNLRQSFCLCPKCEDYRCAQSHQAVEKPSAHLSLVGEKALGYTDDKRHGQGTKIQKESGPVCARMDGKVHVSTRDTDPELW